MWCKQRACSRCSRPARSHKHAWHLFIPYLLRPCLSFLPDIPHGDHAQDHMGQALFPVTRQELAGQEGHLFKRISRDFQLQGKAWPQGFCDLKGSLGRRNGGSISRQETCTTGQEDTFQIILFWEYLPAPPKPPNGPHGYAGHWSPALK